VVDVWKENLLEDLEAEVLEYKTAEEFLIDLREKFERRKKEMVKAVELRRLEQGGKTMKEFVQEFRKAARRSITK